MSIVEKLGGVPGRQTIVETLGDVSGHDVISDVAKPSGEQMLSVSIKDIAEGSKKGFLDLKIPEGTSVIANNAFRSWKIIRSVSIPSTVKTIEASAFSECSYLDKVTISEGVTEIKNYAFQSTAVKNIVIPDGVTKIGESAFLSCNSLESVTLPSSITTIEYYALPWGDTFKHIYVPADSVDKIKKILNDSGNTYAVDLVEAIPES